MRHIRSTDCVGVEVAREWAGVVERYGRLMAADPPGPLLETLIVDHVIDMIERSLRAS